MNSCDLYNLKGLAEKGPTVHKEPSLTEFMASRVGKPRSRYREGSWQHKLMNKLTADKQNSGTEKPQVLRMESIGIIRSNSKIKEEENSKGLNPHFFRESNWELMFGDSKDVKEELEHIRGKLEE